MKRALLTLLFFTLFTVLSSRVAWAADGSILGIHILHPGEAEGAIELLKSEESNHWQYVTIPLSLNDLNKQDDWNKFFATAKENKLIPIVRLATKPEGPVWKIPTKKDIVDLMNFLSELKWPTEERYIIVFNEVNHAKEWGGQLDPRSYAEILRFTSNWAKSEGKNYKVLPAAMDLAASNGGATMEGFHYLEQMYQAQPDLFSYVDYWNSHSYPNPGFSGSPSDQGKNSIKGFTHELAFLKDKTGREYQTFITETGWLESPSIRPRLASYYDYAIEHVWSDPRVKAVTPFVLQGDPGPFSGFTFINKFGEPTRQYEAYQQALKKLNQKQS